jgi:hypothetical protein
MNDFRKNNKREKIKLKVTKVKPWQTAYALLSSL